MDNKLLRDPGLPVANPTTSAWQQPLNRSMITTTDLPTHQDVVIIGSGITGCSIAWHLLHHSESLKVTVLDAREICSGATGRNGGRINCTAVQDFDKYTKLFGREMAARIVRFELAHYQSIKEVVESVGPELVSKSELRWINAVYAVFEDSEVAELRYMLRSFENAFPDLQGRWKVIGKEEVTTKYEISNAKGALVGEAGAAWPYRMVTGVFEHLRSSFPERFSLSSNTPVQSIHKTTDEQHPYSLTTQRGTIRATHIFHSTEGHVAHLLPRLRGILVPRRGQMTVQDAHNVVAKDKLQSWSLMMQGVFDYATMNTKTGLVYIGGGEQENKDYSMGVPSDAEEDLAALAHLGGVLPAAFGGKTPCERASHVEVQASWTGIMGFSLDHAPLVGMLPQELLDRPAGSSTSAEWISAGYGGYGMVNAFLCGKTVAMMMLGRQDQYPEIPSVYLITESRARALSARLGRITSWKDHVQAML
ncbi:hypothetical protein LTR84_010088 [Exophiala bonariae]|uniref:FAD dependent oxidoreductase domain-containing protein n=1 Tax=Exophiala bonariae TaxID=1690606 RepID=A0AAV9NNY3_9EURO|nr:hypothetical protein LTR84_010088 [Exophiala bonariae]